MPRPRGRIMSSMVLNRRYRPKTCRRCGRLMFVISGNTKYCNECKPVVEDEKKKRWALYAQDGRGVDRDHCR